MKKGISVRKLHRDLRLSLCVSLLYVGAWPLGCSFRPSVCSYTLLFRRLTPSADSPVAKAVSTRADRRRAWQKILALSHPPRKTWFQQESAGARACFSALLS
jgi:hypothetical protein